MVPIQTSRLFPHLMPTRAPRPLRGHCAARHVGVSCALSPLAILLGLALAAEGWPISASAGVPTAHEHARLPEQIGPLVARSGQTIEGLRIRNPDGACIVVPSEAHGVVIRNNNIGPCGPAQVLGEDKAWHEHVGVLIRGQDVKVQRNTCHDVRSCVYAAGGARHPIVVEDNLAWDIRGPEPRGQLVQFNRVQGGEGASRIVGNVSDKELSRHPTGYTDHINLFGSEGTPEHPILVACNKLRGGDAKSGSGVIVGDYGGGWAVVRDNIFVMTTNVGGVGCAGCHDTVIENNWVWARGETADTRTNGGFYVMKDEGFLPRKVVFRNNHSIAHGWLYGGRGEISESFYDDKSVQGLTMQGNVFKDFAMKREIWNETLPACR